MASSPITSWQIDGEKKETMTDFTFLGSKITTEGNYSHEIKTLASWKKSCEKPRQHIKRQRHFLPSSQDYGFFSSQVWMWELDHKEDWASKNCAFELWFWRRLLRVRWTAKRSNQSILKEINPEYSLERLMLKLKIQYFRHQMQRSDSLEKNPGTGKVWRQVEKGMTEAKRLGWQRQWTWVWASSRRWWSIGKPGVQQSMCDKKSNRTEQTEPQRCWGFFLCFLAILVSPFVKCLNSLVLLFLESRKNCSNILITSILLDICYIIFFQKVAYFFWFLTVSFEKQSF